MGVHFYQMKTITIAAQKGGAGKTTLALHLGTLAQADQPTLLIDTDPQGSLSFWASRREANTPLVVPIGAARLSEVTSTAKTEGIKYILIDTAPHDSASMAAAMRTADLVLVPARPSALDLHAIESTLTMAKTLKKRALVVLSQTPAKRAFLEPQAVKEAREVVEAMGGKVAQSFISSRVIAAQSVVAGLSVGELEPNGASAQEFSALWHEVKGEL
jgi:chromosome partitioning protein